LGNLIEAYPLRGDARAVFWADAVIEKERIEERVDDQGKSHFYAFGTGQWRRERLTDSTFDLQPVTQGTQASGQAVHIGSGNYQATMTMAAAPQLNAIRADGTHVPPDIPYLSRVLEDNEVDPAYVNVVDLTVQRVKDSTRPYRGRLNFSLWGVDTALVTMNPTPVLLDLSGTVSRKSEVAHRILPDDFRQLLEPTQVLFEVKRDADTVVAATGNSADPFVIPSGLPLPAGGLTASLSVLGVTDRADKIVPQPFLVPDCAFLDVK